jgi:hypothetical protein
MTTVRVSEVKSSSVAEDGSAVTVTIDAKNVGELSLLIQANSFDQLISSLTKAKSILRDQKKMSGHVTVKMPKNWLVACDPQVNGVVILVLEHQTESEAGYAFPPDDARKMAAGLIKNADLVLASKPDQTGHDER